jgi:hypothetical protein
VITQNASCTHGTKALNAACHPFGRAALGQKLPIRRNHVKGLSLRFLVSARLPARQARFFGRRLAPWIQVCVPIDPANCDSFHPGTLSARLGSLFACTGVAVYGLAGLIAALRAAELAKFTRSADSIADKVPTMASLVQQITDMKERCRSAMPAQAGFPRPLHAVALCSRSAP